MSVYLRTVVLVAIASLILASQACAFGEDILALTGQYTFFIKPDPCSNTTYYQKLVPCLAEETVPVPRPTVRVYPVPVPAPQRLPIIVSESPVGCAEGSGPCVQCFPQASSKPGSKQVLGPRPLPVPVPGTEIVPRHVTRPVLRPQWFAVTEIPAPPRPVRKVGAGG
ncbi:MAG: hypothetical protein HY913_16035 [Desulfomonile tiedjei]|nr:hypothetical protein [Desulfomonile tiedjei]